MKSIDWDIEFTLPSISGVLIIILSAASALWCKDTSQLIAGFGIGAGLLGVESKLQNDFAKDQQKKFDFTLDADAKSSTGQD